LYGRGTKPLIDKKGVTPFVKGGSQGSTKKHDHRQPYKNPTAELGEQVENFVKKSKGAEGGGGTKETSEKGYVLRGGQPDCMPGPRKGNRKGVCGTY